LPLAFSKELEVLHINLFATVNCKLSFTTIYFILSNVNKNIYCCKQCFITYYYKSCFTVVNLAFTTVQFAVMTVNVVLLPLIMFLLQ
jgi:hypothetical protein